MEVNGKKITGVIFDLDGTLLNSTGIWKDVDNEFFQKRGLELPSDYAKHIGHIGLDKAAIYTIKRFKLNEKKEDIIKEWKERVLEHYAKVVTLKKGAFEFLKYLKENNIPFCAATANDEDCYKSALVHNNVYHLFDFILEVNGFASGKEKPDIYYECVKRLNSQVESTLVFEDLLMPLKTINDANFISVAIFDEANEDEMEKRDLANIYIEDFTEFFKYIK